MVSDQELVKQLQRYLMNWSLYGKCNIHKLDQRCEYNVQGELTRLHLCHLELTNVPWEVWQFSSLQRLYLNDNQLYSLPAEVCQLSFLQGLYLSHNQLSTLPAEIGSLSTLQWLSLSYNQLITLPVEVGNLSMLITLYLNDNRLSSLPPEVGNLLSLERLEVHNNELSSLPPEVGNLSSLKELNLSNNELSSLPPEVGNLSSLQYLYLPFNQFSFLPTELGNLSSLQTLNLDRNPLLQIPPPEIVAQGTSAILAYLQTLQGAEIERFEAKIILVGEAGMGKTSLLRSLRRQPFMKDMPVTHGIEISTLHVPHPTLSQQEITLYTWDFGGQEIYQATHQFFLTQRSVYLLVWNSRLGVEAWRLPFWLDTIKGYAPDAKILLVATHNDLWSTSTINLPYYQQRYPQIVGRCSISNLTGKGLDDLRAQILDAVVQTPFVGQKWPSAWVEVEQELLAHSEHHIDYSEFIIACSRYKIEDERERETLARYLHDLGKILYFHDDPVLKTLVVLKPNWISKAISQVLVDLQVQKSGGVLEHRELARIWASDEQGQPYPRALYPIFIGMMERFELCYQLEPERPGRPITQSLIPQLLPEQPPTPLLPVPEVWETGQVLVDMRYTLSFVPAGLMSWFLVRTHRYSQRLHWRDGARLTYGGQQAQIELDASQREISIRVWGPFPYTFLLILKRTLDDLLQTFQGLNVQRKIPCRCLMQQQIPHAHSYEDLERQLARGVSEITCSEGIHISLATLLYGIHVSTNPQMEITVQKTQEIVAQHLASEQSMQQRQMSNEERKHMLVRLDQLEHMLVQLYQGQEFLYRTLFDEKQWRRMLEQEKLNQDCPGLFVLERGTVSRINPHDWVSRGYRLRLLCQYPQGPHTIGGEEGYEVRQGKEWWNTMSPWLRRMVKVLELGMPIGKSINEGFKLVDIERFAPEIEVFNEILGDLPDIETIDALNNAHLDVKAQTMQRLSGAELRELFNFLHKVDPGHRWHRLSRVITNEGTILWVCEQHRKEFEVRPIRLPM